MTIMSFLALNLQVAEASVAMHEMPIATAAKEVAIRQATAFPFLCASGEPGHHAGIWRATTAYLPQQIAAELTERRFPLVALYESAFGTKQTFRGALAMSATEVCYRSVRSTGSVERLEFITLLGGTAETGSCAEPLPRVPFWFC